MRRHPTVEVSGENYPWINTPSAHISAVAVEVADSEFLYGSIVGLSNSVRKMAGSVTPADSASLQTVLFSGISSVLSGNPHSGIGKVENSSLANGVLFTASRNLIRAPSLIFAVESKSNDDTKLPLVLKAGIANAGDLPKVLTVMGIAQVSRRRRRC